MLTAGTTGAAGGRAGAAVGFGAFGARVGVVGNSSGAPESVVNSRKARPSGATVFDAELRTCPRSGARPDGAVPIDFLMPGLSATADFESRLRTAAAALSAPVPRLGELVEDREPEDCERAIVAGSERLSIDFLAFFAPETAFVPAQTAAATPPVTAVDVAVPATEPTALVDVVAFFAILPAPWTAALPPR